MTTGSNPRYSSDATSLAEALARFEAEGFTGQFGVPEGGVLRCFSCHTDSPAGQVTLEALIRVEGASDPDDMVAVAALECPHCSARGTAAFKYGPEAPVEESEVLRDLADRRTGSGISAG